MQGGIGLSKVTVRNLILEEFPDLRQKLEDKIFYNNDINRIARAIFIKEKNETFSIEKATYKKNDAVPAKQIELIRKILRGEQPVSSEVRIARERKRKVDQEDTTQPIKKPKQEETRSIEDFFNEKLGLPPNLMSLIAEYINSDITIEFAKEGPDAIPKYLKDNITELDLSNHNLQTKTFLTIIEEFKNLKSIKLHANVNDSELEELCKTLPNLVSLEVQDNYGLTENGFSHIASLRTLKRLKIENLGFPDECDAPAKRIEKAVKSAVTGGSNIETLLLDGLSIDKSTLEFIAQECKNLKCLDISFSAGISNDGINSVFRSCSDILEVKLYGMGIDDSVFEAIGKNCHKLTKLEVEFNEGLFGRTDITDEGLKSISMGCPDLIDIKLTSCRKVTDEGILALTHGIKALQRLSLKKCYNITSEGIGYM